ncbi:GTP cyclohydrolase II-domain-containing protein [Desarmillaria tabescens]|uniref:GTP cyclohydrolase II n=1 Tax=Armillaria tabescens TaxID=1929756 RepID=A0AA39NMK5_ARMTA|nr:GTP cyclohydrolase II-domain-containing protein [Desarmillaria tabescens]KAK0468421.1 GTP cyclohydrolase II-domain-containing protein [Desarmillaria tabescens]
MSERAAHDALSDSDAALLDMLTGPSAPTATTFARRDAALDPLIMAAAFASGPHVTRNHYHHDFFPGVMLPKAEGAWDWTKFTGQDASAPERKKLAYVSRQAPRRQRLALEGKENDHPREQTDTSLSPIENISLSHKKRRTSSSTPVVPAIVSTAEVGPDVIPKDPAAELSVKCMARTRIPTPHGPVFLHLYHNNRDDKEHLAIVVDPAQLADKLGAVSPPPIRSHTLDAVWSKDETEMDRITRGAYVGRLSPTSQHASMPPSGVAGVTLGLPAPLIRIHSECFTGETVGSMRCDCGEQLDEAIRLISQPITISLSCPLNSSTPIPGRGAVVYLRQEGRGIGLLSKIRAYNLQDIGHDTVTANLMLGHGADERGYDIAVAILRDLGLSDGVRVLTNNPDKVQALEKDGLKVVERVPMIPRSWKCRQENSKANPDVDPKHYKMEDHVGATLIGGKAVYGEDLDKYLRTKVLKMGHILPLWMEDVEA